MKNTGIKVLCGALLCGAFFGVNNVSAAYNYNTTSEFSARDTSSSGWNGNTYIRMNFKMCVKSNVLEAQNSYNMYTWDNSNTGGNLASWPGVPMPDVEDDAHCYTRTIDDGKHYNLIIFNGGGKQTIDLDVINDSGKLVNSLAYLFDESDVITEGNQYGKYKGRWAVNDTSALVDMVAVAKGLNEEKDKYTIDSYAAVVVALGDDVAVEEVTVENQDQYELGADYVSKLDLSNDVLGKLIIGNEGDTYTSEYLDRYNELGEALNNLVERKSIVVDDNIDNGIVEAAYKENSDSEIDIQVSPDTGYEVRSITVKEIVSYDQSGNPVFGEVTDIDVNPDQNDYEYSFDQSASIKGLYISAVFGIKSCVITVDDKEYAFDYGTTYAQMLEELDLEKDGRKFLYLVDEDGNEVGDDYVVTGDARFTVVYEKDDSGSGGEGEDNDLAVPDTGSGQKSDQGVNYGLIGCAFAGGMLGAVLMIMKQKREDQKKAVESAQK